jgi:DNA modification methylase
MPMRWLDLLAGEETTTEGDTDEDAVPEDSGTVVSRAGDVWICGEHRVLCGDATDPDAYATVLGDEIADMVFTDPPYNVNYANSAKDKMRGKDRAILNDNLGDGFYDFLLAALTPTVAHCQGWYLRGHVIQRTGPLAGGVPCCRWPLVDLRHLGQEHFYARSRRLPAPVRAHPLRLARGCERHWCGDRDQGDVWQIKKPQKNDLHPTMKPVELVERAIRNSSRPGDVVMDPFGGSGTTMIAAHKSGRKARLIELDPKYVDVIVRRWQGYAGAQAIRQSDGVVFDALSSGGELRQDVAAGDVGDVADVTELAGLVSEDDTAD